MAHDESNEWIFNDSTTTPGGRRTCQFSGPRGLSASVVIAPGFLDEPGYFNVTVTFRHVTQAYARAEAARLFAELHDTIGDLETSGSEPLQIERPIIAGVDVDVCGADAVHALAAHFGLAALEGLS